MNSLSRWLCLGAALTPLVLTTTAHATGAKKLPVYDLTTEKGLKKSASLFHYTVEGKVKDFPTKIAIPYFQIRYRFESPAEINSNSSGWSRTSYVLQLEDEDYTTLTDMLYAQAVAELTAEGFEVIPRETVLASASYQALKGETEEKVNGTRARYAPSGMKNLRTRAGQSVDAPDFAAINREVGADASLAIFANIGICNVEVTKKHVGGVMPCLYGGMLQYPGLNLEFVGGAKDKGDSVKPEWAYRIYKENFMFKYGGDVGYDTAFFGMNPAMTPGRRHFWRDREWDAQTAAFIEGGGTVFDDAMTVAMWVLDSKTAKQRAAAGVAKREKPEIGVMAAPAAPVVEEVAPVVEEPAPVVEPLPEVEAPPAAEPAPANDGIDPPTEAPE